MDVLKADNTRMNISGKQLLSAPILKSDFKQLTGTNLAIGKQTLRNLIEYLVFNVTFKKKISYITAFPW